MPPATQSNPTTFRADMLSRRQQSELNDTGTFTDRRGQRRDAQGRRVQPQNVPGATQSANPAQTTTAGPSDALRALSIANAPAPVPNPVPADQIGPAADPQLPEPTAFDVQSEFVMSAAENVNRQRASFEGLLESRRTEIATERERLTNERDRLMRDGVEPNLAPFREELEKNERERLKVEENFFANQKLTDELDTLLTQGNTLIQQMQGLPVHQRVVQGRVNNALRDVSARAGVIQAVMSARNGQIAQAYNLIDRSVVAITADRNDQLAYYETLINFNQSDTLKLDREDEKLANEQIALAKSDLARAQATADYIKELMINPESADFMAQAGVTLLDSVEAINTKLSAETGRRQVESTKNAYVEAGYEFVPFADPGTPGLTQVEVNGETLAFRVRPGSQLSMDIDQFELQQEATRASIANIYDQISARRVALREAAAKAIKEAATVEDAKKVEVEADTEQALEIKTLANELLTADGMSAAVGFGFRKSVVGSIPFVSGNAIAGTSRADFEAKAERLSNLLTLDNLSLMKGVLTDRDVQLLATAGSNLSNLNMSEKAYKDEVGRIISTMDRTIMNNGLTTEQALFWGVIGSEDDANTLDSLWDAL